MGPKAAVARPRRRWAGTVRPRRAPPARRWPSRIFRGPVARAVHSSVAPGPVAPASVGPAGPVTLGALPVGQDEEYVGAPLRTLVPLLGLIGGLMLASAVVWERRKDRRVTQARQVHGRGLWHLRRRASENPS